MADITLSDITLKIKRGNLEDLPASAEAGELLLANSDNIRKLYVGTGSDVVPISNSANTTTYSNIVSNLIATDVQAAIDELDFRLDGINTYTPTPYSCNYGFTNQYGYADIINGGNPPSNTNILVNFNGDATDIYGNVETVIGSPTYTGDKFNSNGNTGLKFATFTTLGLGSWTIEGRFKFNSNSSSYPLFYSKSAYGFVLERHTGNGLSLSLATGNSSSFDIGSAEGSKTNFDTSSAYHICVQFDGVNKYRVFVDGTLDIVITSSTKVRNNFEGFLFGMRWDEGTFLAGTMDDLRVSVGQQRYATGDTIGASYFTPPATGTLTSDQTQDNTSVSFKVGGIYDNLGVTFPNGRHYVISEIPDVINLNDAGTYTFIIKERNLVDLNNGTYRAVVEAVKIGYNEIRPFPALTSGSHAGVTATYLGNNPAITDPYVLFDNDINTKVAISHSGWPPQTYSPAGNIDTSEGISRCSSFQLVFDNTRALTNLIINAVKVYGGNGGNNYDGGRSGSGNILKYLTSTDGGSTWSAESTASENMLSGQFTIPINASINAIKLRFYHQPLVIMDVAYPGEKWYTSWGLGITDINIYETITYTGGNITEGYTYPENQDVSIVPVMSGNSTPSTWTISASSEGAGAEAWRAFNGTYDALYCWQAVGDTGWIKATIASGTFNLSRVAISINSQWDRAPKDFTIKDQADNVLATFTNQIFSPYETKYFDVVGTGISAVKIDVTANNGNASLKIDEIKIYTTVTVADGDLHVFVNKDSIEPKIRVNSAYQEEQFTKIGEATKGAVILGTPITYAFNGRYMSVPTVRTQNASYTLNHNIGVNNKFIKSSIFLINKTSELGFSAGERCDDVSNNAYPISRAITKNTMTVRPNSAYIENLSNGTSNAITFANWYFVEEAERNFHCD